MLFDSNFIDEEIFEDEELRNRIIKLSYVYKLTEEEMKDVFVKTINHDKRYDYPALSKNARSTFQKKYKVDAPKLVSKSEDNYIQSIQDDVTLKLCNELESMSPADVLESLSGMKATPSELKIAEDLLTNTKLSKGAVNFMLLYVSKEKDGELPSYNYFEKIAATWSRAKVKSALDAYKYMEKKKTEVKEPKTYKPGKKVAALPDWYTDYEKTLMIEVQKDSDGENKTIEIIDMRKSTKQPSAEVVLLPYEVEMETTSAITATISPKYTQKEVSNKFYGELTMEAIEKASEEIQKQTSKPKKRRL
jgi:replication initiation and membrane attachment protein DnaB